MHTAVQNPQQQPLNTLHRPVERKDGHPVRTGSDRDQPHPGQRRVLGVIIAAVTCTLLTASLLPPAAPQAPLRYPLTILMLVMLYRGNTVARWLAAFVYASGGFAFLRLAIAEHGSAGAGIAAAIGLVYLACGLVLGLHPDVEDFFRRDMLARPWRT